MRYDGFLGLAYSWEEQAALEAAEYVWNGLVLGAGAMGGVAFSYALRSLHKPSHKPSDNLFVENVKAIWELITSPYRWVTDPIQTAKNFAYYATHMAVPQVLTYQLGRSFDAFWHKAGVSFLRPSMERLVGPVYNAIFDVDYELSMAPRGFIPNHNPDPGYIRGAFRFISRYSISPAIQLFKSIFAGKSEDDFVGQRYYQYGESFASTCESTGGFLKDKAEKLVEALTESSASQYVWDTAESLTEGNSIIGPKLLLATPFAVGIAAYNAYRWWHAPAAQPHQQQQQQINVQLQQAPLPAANSGGQQQQQAAQNQGNNQP